MKMKKIAVLGSTGSIGTQTLDIVSKNRDLQVVGLAAGSNITLLEEQIRTFHPLLAAVGDEEKAKENSENAAKAAEESEASEKVDEETLQEITK